MSKLEITGLDELMYRMRQFPDRLAKVMDITMQGTLLKLWESVPPYPAQGSRPPTDYVRTGTLGRTLGVSENGTRMGQPSIYEVKPMSGGMIEGEFGTNLDYAPYVIGENEQAWMHVPYWWTIMDVAKRALEGITRLWEITAEELAEYLDGKRGQ